MKNPEKIRMEIESVENGLIVSVFTPVYAPVPTEKHVFHGPVEASAFIEERVVALVSAAQ